MASIETNLLIFYLNCIQSNVVTTSSSDSKTLVLRQKVPDVKTLLSGLQLNPLPPPKARDSNIAHAPKRNTRLSLEGKKVSKYVYF